MKQTPDKTVMTPEISTVVKAAAIVLMFFCHFFNRSWITEGVAFQTTLHVKSIFIEDILCDSGGFCVALFAFILGYGFYFGFKKECSWKKSFRKTALLYIDFWLVLVCVFVPVFLMLGNSLDAKGYIANFLAFDHKINSFDWYVAFYAITLLVMTFMEKMIAARKNGTVFYIIAIAVLPMLTVGKGYTFFNNCLTYIPVVMAGYISARFKLIDFIYDKINTNIKISLVKFVIGGGIIFLTIFGRYFLRIVTAWKITAQFDWILAIFFVEGTALIFQKIHISNLSLKGKVITNLWYLHAIFFGVYSQFQKVAYWPRLSFLIIMWAFVLLTPFAWIFANIQEWLNKKINASFKTFDEFKTR